MKEIKTSSLTDEIRVVDNPELIKVKTIKAKYVSQMAKYTDPEKFLGKTIVVLGRTDANCICLDLWNGELFKVHQIDYTDALKEKKMLTTNMEYVAAVKEAWEEYHRIPMLFAE